MSPRELHEVGFSVIACGRNKQALTRWGAQQTVITQPPESTHYGIVCGKVSGNLECLDYDAHHDPLAKEEETSYQKFIVNLDMLDPGLINKLTIETTPNGGLHLVYRCRTEVGGRLLLASTTDGKTYFFETRGEGNYFVCAGSEGYKLINKDYENICVITTEQREHILAAARATSLDTSREKTASDGAGQSREYVARVRAEGEPRTPLDFYNEEGDVLELLEYHGWKNLYTRLHEGRIVSYLQRPRKDKGSISATYNYIENKLYVFSSNAHPFEAGACYNRSAVYAYLNCEGDFSVAARELAKTMPKPPDQLQQLEERASNEQRAATEEEITTKVIIDALKKGELGDAKLFSLVKKGNIVYDHVLGEWFFFRGHWQRDDTAQINVEVANILIGLYERAHLEISAGSVNKDTTASMRTDTANLCKVLQSRVHTLRAWKRTPSILKFSMHNIGIVGNEWDRNPDVLGVANGVVELTTGVYRQSLPHEYIRTVAPTEYIADADCPIFKKFINDIFDGNEEIVSFMQRMLGYATTGHTTEHIYPILWGATGRNGKDTLLHIIQHVLGASLARAVHSDVLIDNRGGPQGASPELYAMMGMRIGWINETEEQTKIKASSLKLLTGGSTITCRPLYGNMVQFDPTHVLMLVTNHKPGFSADDEALWQRIILIPFTQQFVDNPFHPHQHFDDKDLFVKLKAESSGILNWLIKGALEWRRIGLACPQVLRAATHEYKSEQPNIVLDWVEECCELGEHLWVEGSSARRHFRNWCEQKGWAPISPRTFTRDILNIVGIEAFRSKHGIRGRGFEGFNITREALANSSSGPSEW